MRRSITAVMLCLCLFVACMGDLCLAGTTLTGTVHVSDSLRVRKGAGTSYAQVGSLYNGDVVTILDTVSVGSDTWYRIRKGTLEGYASADYITVNSSTQTEEDFEKYLTQQKFPESYKAGLRELHKLHPTWVFKAQILTVNWTDALAAESKVSRNQILSPDAWKSMEYGAYNWNTRTYVEWDSGGWVSAAQPVIAYYMDPRNFLNDTYVFAFEELSFSDTQTVSGVKAILPDAIDNIADDLLKAASEAGISAYFLATKIVQEGTVSNGLALGTVSGYEGYYNYFDIDAYAHDGRSAVINGALYAKKHGWDTPYKCLLESATGLVEGYISLGQNTTYYQKFNVVNTKSGLYKHQYMSNTVGAAAEGKIRRKRIDAAHLEEAYTFIIPVYQSMPATAVPLPSKTGDNNNFLSSLTVSGQSLTPTFERYTSSYAVQVAGNVKEVTVSATADNSKATVTGAGKVSLAVGQNIVRLSVTSTSGAVRTYTVTITREKSSASDTPSDAPSVQSDRYLLADTVTKVEPQTAVTDFLKAFTVTNGTAKLFSAANKEKTAGIVANGDTLQIVGKNGTTVRYPVLILGDVSGDGAITSLDLRITQKHILSVQSLTGSTLSAADVSKDGAVSSLDLRMTQKFILHLITTVQ